MSHPENATVFLKDKERAKWHDDTLWIVRQKRDVTIHPRMGKAPRTRIPNKRPHPFEA